MARKSIMKKTGRKSLWALITICLLCFVAFFCVACGNTPSEKEDIEDLTYTKTEVDDQLVTNGNFEFGSADVKLKNFPQTSATGWSRATDNSATSSDINSGIINTETAAWKQLMLNLLDDTDFQQYIKDNFGVDLEQLIEDYDHDETLAKNAAVELLENRFLNPGVYVDDEGNSPDGTKIYMLNNYVKTYAASHEGTAQKLTSSATLTVSAGSYGKLSFWVKTANIKGTGKYGANVRITPSYNGITQKTYAVYGINTEGITTNNGWQQYVFYFKADNKADITLKLVFGLGFGNGNATLTKDYCEGTLYLDDVVFEEVDEVSVETHYDFDFSYESSTSSDTDYIKAASITNFAYLNGDIENITDAAYYKDLNYTSLGYYTTSETKDALGNDITSKTLFGDDSNVTYTDDSSKITLSDIKNASYTVKLTSSDFKVALEGYVFVSFKLNITLNRLNANGITVYVIDRNGSSSLTTSAKTYSYSTENGNGVTCGIIISNNFPEKDPDGEFVKEREFDIVFVLGPTASAISQKTVKSNFANGEEIVISDFKIASGKTYEYERENYVTDADGNISSYDVTDIKTANYNYYKLFSTIADSSVALYSGMSADYSESSDTTTYSLVTSKSDIGTILSVPANAADYTGLVADHIYIKEGGTESATNTRSGYISGKNHAGLVNTKYLDVYKTIDGLSDIDTALNYTGSSSIQPLMIYNDEASPNAYGFIGNSTSISSSAWAKISLKIRVYGDNAKAYVYLINTASSEKDVITIDAVSNTDGKNYITSADNTAIKKLSFEGITAADMNEDGWLELSFYIATGASSIDFRLEVWNGGRDNSDATKSGGYVFVDDITVTTTGAFTESSNFSSAFTDATSALYSIYLNDNLDKNNTVLYKRVLTETEQKFNNEYPDEAIEYAANYIWAESDNVKYAVYNTIDPVASNPYASKESSEEETEEETTSGCSSVTTSSTFWLSFSSILLGVALIIAIVMLVIKNVRRRNGGNQKVKSQYKVISRHKEERNKKIVKVEKKTEEKEEYEDENVLPAENDVEGETPDNVIETEEYVYGDVQDFGNDIEEVPQEEKAKNEEKAETSEEEKGE